MSSQQSSTSPTGMALLRTLRRIKLVFNAGLTRDQFWCKGQLL